MYIPGRIRTWARARGFDDSRIVSEQYHRHLSRRLDLAHPRGLHEKFCWLKLYGMTPLHSFCSDKITAPAYVDSILGPGHTTPRYFATYDIEKIGPAAVPEQSCVIKTGHDCNGVFLIPDIGSYDWVALRETLRRRLSRNFYYRARERQYKPIRAGVLGEEFLRSANGSPVEIKVFCFHGKVRFIALIIDGIRTKSSRRAFLDPDWTALEANRLRAPFEVGMIDRPACLDQMLANAERLAEPFSFVRVDFFLVDGRPYVGELTFTPSAGYEIYLPDSFEIAAGDMLDHRAPTRNWRQRLAAAQACLDATSHLI